MKNSIFNIVDTIIFFKYDILELRLSVICLYNLNEWADIYEEFLRELDHISRHFFFPFPILITQSAGVYPPQKQN